MVVTVCNPRRISNRLSPEFRKRISRVQQKNLGDKDTGKKILSSSKPCGLHNTSIHYIPSGFAIGDRSVLSVIFHCARVSHIAATTAMDR
jgi:hypothetical protein